MLDLFDRIRIQDDEVRDWFRRVLRAKTRHKQKADEIHQKELARRLTLLRRQQDRLLNLRLMGEIDEPSFAREQQQLRDEVAELSLQTDLVDQAKTERGEVALKALELSQTRRDESLAADYRAKRRLLEIVGLNYRIDGVNLVCDVDKPFDVLLRRPEWAENRGDRI